MSTVLESAFVNAMNDTAAQINDDTFYQTLHRANEYYNKLVNEGIIKKRGFQLRGIEDTNLFNYSINNTQNK